MHGTDFGALFRAMPALCLALSPDAPRFTVLAATEAFREATGRRPGELEGKGFFDLLEEAPPGQESEGAAELRASLDQVVRTGRPHAPPPAATYRLPGGARRSGGKRWDGPWRPLHTPVVGRDGGVTCVLHQMDRCEAVGGDAGLRAREDAAAMRLLVRRILDAVPVGVVVHRGPDHVIDLANETFRGIVGPRALLGRTPSEAVPELPPEVAVEALDRVYRLGQRIRLPATPVRLRRSPGHAEERQLEVLYTPLRDHRGMSTGLVGIVADVSETVQLRNRVRELRLDAESARMALEELHVDLETRIADQTRELAESNEALAGEVEERKRAEELRTELLRRLTAAEQEERRRISGELHDHMGQLVTGLLLGLKALENQDGSPVPVDEVAELRHLAERVAEAAHDVALRLRPAALDTLGLETALRGHVEEWIERHGIPVDLHMTDLGEHDCGREVEEGVFRVVQEGLTNVVKHASARQVSLLVECRDSILSLILEDDGDGFDVEDALQRNGHPPRLGLLGLRERVGRLGGSVQIESTPGDGSTLFVRIPVAPQRDPVGDGEAP